MSGYNQGMETIIEVLGKEVRRCFVCTGMNHTHVLGPGNGSPEARMMFIGEAPGRLGAALTGVPFTLDASGRRFEALLAEARIRRSDVFVTNALLCNPLRDGRNRPPARREVAACTQWLRAQIDAVSPGVVVTLGRVALEGLRMIEPHDYALCSHVGQRLEWRGRTLVPLYHPSPRTAGRRSFAQQLTDFRSLITDC